MDPLFEAPDPASTVASLVTFEPGARAAWHTHPRGQLLVVTAGCGIVQSIGGKAVRIRAGDVIWCPPGEKHWHGATGSTAMSHISIVERVDGKPVHWMEKVSEKEYRDASDAE